MADTFRLARSAHIAAPPATVHSLVDNFHRWGEWSPWAKMDAGHLQEAYEGATSGPGAIYGWIGPKTGEGRMQILTSTPQRIVIQLDFIKPMKRLNQAEFTFTPEDGGTKVDWVMTGPRPLFDKIMSLIFNMEKMVGGQFAEGLANMKAVAEAAAPKAAPAPVAAAPAAAKPAAVPKPKAAAKPKPAAKPAAVKAPAPAKAKAVPAPKAAAKPAAPVKAKAPAKAAPAPKPAVSKAKPAPKPKAATAAKAKPATVKPKAAAKPKTAVAKASAAAKARPAAKPKTPAKKS